MVSLFIPAQYNDTGWRGTEVGSEPGCAWGLVGKGVDQAAVERGIQGHAELAVVVIPQGNKAEGLHARALILARRLKDFRHGVDGTGTSMKGDFDEIACQKLLGNLKKAAGNGNRLKFCARTLTALSLNGSGYGPI